MAMRARVELRGCLTHEAGGRSFRKGAPQILTSPSEIAYYESQADFAVTMLDVTKAKAKAKPKPPSEETEAEETSEEYTEAELRGYKKADLKEIAEELGLDTKGTVNDLIGRILDAG